jgi:hypothetical protein
MAPTIRSARQENLPFSFSRWTDVPAAKWAWMREQFAQGHVIAFDPRTGVPSRWSLDPSESVGMVFWTKDPRNLTRDAALVQGHKIQVHVTLTGWEEVEHGAPDIDVAAKAFVEAAWAFGPENVFWRFSPVPLVEDVAQRFAQLCHLIEPSGVKSVYLSFLQENDLMPETRSVEERLSLMSRLAAIGAAFGVRVLLCNEDRSLLGGSPHENLGSGVCVSPGSFQVPGIEVPPSEGCGCVLMLDPFTINESCTMGCTYCYAADKTLAQKKRNTTRGLPVIK